MTEKFRVRTETNFLVSIPLALYDIGMGDYRSISINEAADTCECEFFVFLYPFGYIEALSNLISDRQTKGMKVCDDTFARNNDITD